MNEIRTIALNGINDFGTTTQQQESIDRSWQTLLDFGYNRKQIQTSIVRELEKIDVEFWHKFQDYQTIENQQNCYAIRQRLNDCSVRLRLMK